MASVLTHREQERAPAMQRDHGVEEGRVFVQHYTGNERDKERREGGVGGGIHATRT